jgi:hypothetical protein
MAEPECVEVLAALTRVAPVGFAVGQPVGGVRPATAAARLVTLSALKKILRNEIKWQYRYQDPGSEPRIRSNINIPVRYLDNLITFLLNWRSGIYIFIYKYLIVSNIIYVLDP